MQARSIHHGAVTRRAAALLITIAGLWACSGEKRGVDPQVRAQLAQCARSMADAARVERADKLRVLTAGCSPACPGLDEYAGKKRPDENDVLGLLDRCSLFCTSDVRAAWLQAAPAERFPLLGRECGPESYALTADSAPLLSPDWVVLLRVHEWLERSRRHADKDTRAALERAGMHAHFRLPVPARLGGVYALPASRAGRPSDAAFYVIIEPGQGTEPTLRAGALPVARVRPGDLERRPVPGGDFPGRRLDAPARDYAELVRLLEGMHPAGSHATIDRTPLVLADHSTPVRALMQATIALGTPRFAVGVSGHTALAHPIELAHLTTTGSAAPMVKALGDGFVVVGNDDDIHVPRTDKERLAVVLDKLSVHWAPQDKIEVELPDTATLADLTAILDIIAGTRFTVALLRAPSG